MDKIKASGMSIGSWAFIIGLIIAIIVAIFSASNVPIWAVIVLAILGIVVGLLNISEKEVTAFLIATIGFLLSFQSLSNIFVQLKIGGDVISAFFSLLSVFIAPAAAVVAIKALFKITHD